MYSSKGRAIRKQKTESHFSSVSAPTERSCWYDGKRLDALDFLVSKSVYLAGVELFGSKDSSYAVQLDLYSGSDLISRTKRTVATDNVPMDGEYYGFDIYFERPVRLVQGCHYTVKAVLNGPHSYYGLDGKREIKHEDVNISFANSNEDLHTDVKHGQFCKFIF